MHKDEIRAISERILDLDTIADKGPWYKEDGKVWGDRRLYEKTNELYYCFKICDCACHGELAEWKNKENAELISFYRYAAPLLAKAILNRK